MSLKDAFSGLKEELGKDLHSENEKNKSEINTNNSKDDSHLTPTVIKSSKTEVQENPDPQKKVKRKVGKRSNPDFTQAPAFIRKSTHQQVKIHLITDPDFNDYSELVEALLVQWLEGKKSADL